MEPKFKIGDVVKCHVPQEFKESRWCDSATLSLDGLVGIVCEIYEIPAPEAGYEYGIDTPLIEIDGQRGFSAPEEAFELIWTDDRK